MAGDFEDMQFLNNEIKKLQVVEENNADIIDNEV